MQMEAVERLNDFLATPHMRSDGDLADAFLFGLMNDAILELGDAVMDIQRQTAALSADIERALQRESTG